MNSTLEARNTKESIIIIIKTGKKLSWMEKGSRICVFEQSIHIRHEASKEGI
jgi:hypothetical protein